jgi:hypothetical protein
VPKWLNPIGVPQLTSVLDAKQREKTQTTNRGSTTTPAKGEENVRHRRLRARVTVVVPEAAVL